MRCAPPQLLLVNGRSFQSIRYSFFLQRRNLASRMAQRTYNDAVDALNTLQSSFKVIEERRRLGIRADENTIEEMRSWLGRIGYKISDLNRLNIVHVAGTKGKGSTCAYVDSILNFYRKSKGIPSKVGLFTSPHLLAVRERIRINSEPISEELFAKYFFEVWDALETSAVALGEDPKHKPVYFRYLTLMSYHAFLQEEVDAAVYEVGVGGAFDGTNLVEQPAVTGITALGIDHTFMLGDTIEEISWHKAGIMKISALGFTVPQVPAAMEVLKDVAKKKGVLLKTVEIDPRIKDVKILPDAPFQKMNASMAIKLSGTVLRQLHQGFGLQEEFLPQEFIDGLEQVVWRGRCETKLEGNLTWYLDGAHTKDSLKVAAQWYDSQCSSSSGTRVLIFNQQGRSEAVELLAGLFSALRAGDHIEFDHVIFCTNITSANTGYKKDFVNLGYDPAAIANLTVQNAFAAKWSELDPKAKVVVMPSIEESIDYVRALDDPKGVSAFITGSLHLIGGALSLLEDTKAF